VDNRKRIAKNSSGSGDKRWTRTRCRHLGSACWSLQGKGDERNRLGIRVRLTIGVDLGS
jgi:hypothetical protein